MAVKWTTVQAGQTLYDTHRVKSDRANVSQTATWDVVIVSIDHDAGSAMVRWNGNSPRRYSRRDVERLRRSRPQRRTR